MLIIIHQTHYEKSDWSWAFNQFTIACELDMINAIEVLHGSHVAWLEQWKYFAYERTSFPMGKGIFCSCHATWLSCKTSISAADIAFIMSSSTSAWLLSPLECSPQKQNGWTLRFCFWGWIMWKMYNKTIIEFGFRMISWIIKTPCLCYLPQPLALADNTDLGFDNSWYHAQPHPIIVYHHSKTTLISSDNL